MRRERLIQPCLCLLLGGKGFVAFALQVVVPQIHESPPREDHRRQVERVQHCVVRAGERQFFARREKQKPRHRLAKEECKTKQFVDTD